MLLLLLLLLLLYHVSVYDRVAVLLQLTYSLMDIMNTMQRCGGNQVWFACSYVGVLVTFVPA